MASDGRLGPRNLVLAAVAAEGFRNAHVDLSTYFTRRYELLHEALGAHHELRSTVDGTRTQSHSFEVDHSALESTMRRSIVLVNNVPNPLEEFLEAPPTISDLYRRLGDRVYGAAAELRGALVDLALDVLLKLEPGLTNATTNQEALFLAGLPREEPDPLDYW